MRGCVRVWVRVCGCVRALIETTDPMVCLCQCLCQCLWCVCVSVCADGCADLQIVEDLEALFVAYDDDDSGELDVDEVKELVGQVMCVCACVCVCVRACIDVDECEELVGQVMCACVCVCACACVDVDEVKELVGQVTSRVIFSIKSQIEWLDFQSSACTHKNGNPSEIREWLRIFTQLLASMESHREHVLTFTQLLAAGHQALG